MTDFGALRATVDHAFADLARIDVVVSNAGYGLFGAALVRPDPVAAYDDTPVGEIRCALDNGTFEIVGDPDRMAEAMIACGDGDTAPLRLTLGSKAFDTISAALRSRLSALEAQKEIALSADKQP